MLGRFLSGLKRAGNTLTSVWPQDAVDNLTGLDTRVVFLQRLDEKRESRLRGTVALLDIDLFKPFNDRYGQDVGDDALMLVSTRLREALPAGCELARAGGDEFLVFVGGATAAEAVPILREVIAAVREPIPLGAAAGAQISLSAGVCELSGRWTSQQVFTACDETLHVAKNRGRRRILVWGHGMRAEANSRKASPEMLAVLQRRQLQLVDVTCQDELTKLRNQKALEAILDERVGPDHGPGGFERAAVVYIDVDHFSDFNHRHGTLAGDQALTAVAKQLRQAARHGDLIYRIHGPEFVVVLPGITDRAARVAAERYRRAIEHLRIRHASSPVAPHLTVTIGVTCAEHEGTIGQLMVASAELVMLAKLNARRNEVHAASLETRPSTV